MGCEPVNPKPEIHKNDTDVSLLEYNLSLSIEERTENHQRALDLLNEILKARKELYGEFEPSPQKAT